MRHEMAALLHQWHVHLVCDTADELHALIAYISRVEQTDARVCTFKHRSLGTGKHVPSSLLAMPWPSYDEGKGCLCTRIPASEMQSGGSSCPRDCHFVPRALTANLPEATGVCRPSRSRCALRVHHAVATPFLILWGAWRARGRACECGCIHQDPRARCIGLSKVVILAFSAPFSSSSLAFPVKPTRAYHPELCGALFARENGLPAEPFPRSLLSSVFSPSFMW